MVLLEMTQIRTRVNNVVMTTSSFLTTIWAEENQITSSSGSGLPLSSTLDNCVA